MRLAVREMIRRPGRFLAATIILTFVSILIVYLGGINPHNAEISRSRKPARL